MSSPAGPLGHRPRAFDQARAQAEIDVRMLRARAAVTVANQAVDDDDRTRLLSMLGLDDPPQSPRTDHTADVETVSLPELEQGLAGYVQAVAIRLGIPAEATGYEISDTITAYLGLPDRRAECPNRDLMLAWNERHGWLIAAETRPNEPPQVLGYLGGYDILPHPHAVAQFVTDLRNGHQPDRSHPIHPPHTPRRLAVLLSRHLDLHPGLSFASRHLGPLP